VILLKKREMKIQVVKAKDKNVEILLSTSFVSSSLINVYYVDGTSQTFCVDEATTVKDLSTLVAKDFSTMSTTTTGFVLSLFEVTQDLNDPKVPPIPPIPPSLLPSAHLDTLNKLYVFDAQLLMLPTYLPPTYLPTYLPSTLQ